MSNSACRETPQFDTHRPEPAEGGGSIREIRFFKIAQVDLGDNGNLLLCNLCRDDASQVGTRNYIIKQAVASSHAVGDVIQATRPSGGTSGTYMGSQVPWMEIAGGGLNLRWGKLKNLWVPGTNQVTLTPCKFDGTAISGPSGADVPGIYIQLPLSSPAQCLSAAVDDILPYLPLAPGTYMLFQPPTMPRFTTQYQVLANAGLESAAPNLVADWNRSHG